MRLIILAFVLAYVTAITWASLDESNVDFIVASAIEEATESYNEKMLEATKNGAQTIRNRGAKSNAFTDRISQISDIYKDALDILITRHKMDKNKAMENLIRQLPSECSQTPTCDATDKYRTMDGTCNNLQNPLRGAANMPFLREVPAAYGPNDEPRGGLNHSLSTLPAARSLTLTIHTNDSDAGSYDSKSTHMVPQFGQFLDHDITLTPEGGFACCDNPEGNDNCWSIPVTEDDPFYKNHNKTCLDFTRSTAFCYPTLGRREQMNAITAYIDGSVVYGSDRRVTKLLREFNGGRLEANSEHNGYLPWTSDVDPSATGTGRVKAGDVRADEMPGLAVVQSLFHREHNRIAKYFVDNTDWSEEVIFQETRRIIAAELQQITYNEYLPAVLGADAMTKYGLTLADGFSKYDSGVDATIFNSFATAAYRFGHTMVNGLIKFLIQGTISTGGYRVRDNYFSSEEIVKKNNGSGYEYILGGLVNQNAQKYDAEISEDLTNFLFKRVGDQVGSDLAARNIQRGRDHGLPAYNEFRKHCKIPELGATWETPRPENIKAEVWDKLKTVYASPRDIDLYTGGLVETTVAGGQAGDTFVCLMGLQFQRIKDGDRFFFTHENQVGSFTEQQLAALQKRTLGDIICQNSLLTEVAKNVFVLPDDASNPKVACNSPDRQIDLSLFGSKEVNKDNGSSRLQWISMTYVAIFAFILNFY